MREIKPEEKLLDRRDSSGRPPRPPRPEGHPKPSSRPPRPPRPPRPNSSPHYHVHSYSYSPYPHYAPSLPPITVQPILPNAGSSQTAYLRFLNAAAGSVPLDVYVNGVPVSSNLQYGDMASYATITSATNRYHTVIVYQAGSKGNPLFSTVIPINQGSVYTAAIGGVYPNIGLQLASIPKVEIPTQMALFRFDHLSPNNIAIDLVMNGRKVFSCVKYWDITPPIGLQPGSYKIQFFPCGSATPFFTLPNLKIDTGAYTLYAIGLADGEPRLDAILRKD